MRVFIWNNRLFLKIKDKTSVLSDTIDKIKVIKQARRKKQA